MASRSDRAAAQLGRGVGHVEDTLESLASGLGDTLGDRLPALAERLAERFPEVAEQLAERLGDRVPALQRYAPNRRSPGADALAFIGGLLFGAFAGAVAAVLLAPSDGKTLRARLQGRIDELMGYSPPPAEDDTGPAEVVAPELEPPEMAPPEMLRAAPPPVQAPTAPAEDDSPVVRTPPTS